MLNAQWLKRWPVLSLVALLVLGMWLSSGTLAPYATTLPYNPSSPGASVIVSEDCQYLYNGDHEHYFKANLLVGGNPYRDWKDSIYLRRILYPLAARPFVALWGFEQGGVVANIFYTLIAVLHFALFVRKRWGDRAGLSALALLSTYPGIAYWVGLPYNQAAIVPVSLWSTMLLLRAQEVLEIPGDQGRRKYFQFFVIALGLGTLSLAYELLPIFGVAMLGLLVVNKKFKLIPFAAVGLVLPTLTVSFALSFFVPLSNSNSVTFGNILRSYFGPYDVQGWTKEIIRLPYYAWVNFAYSNFLFLPLTFVALRIFLGNLKLLPVERFILAAVALLFFFNHLAPPYPGWQMRGEWIVRIYQPVFVVFILYVARSFSMPKIRLQFFVLSFVFILNGVTVLGPSVGFTNFAAHLYHRFYRHNDEGENDYVANLKRFGRRPLGFCNPADASLDQSSGD